MIKRRKNEGLLVPFYDQQLPTEQSYKTTPHFMGKTASRPHSTLHRGNLVARTAGVYESDQ